MVPQSMDFGQYLREARERRGVSLRQIAVSTRISQRQLEALENNEIRKLPGGIFSRAFVRSYAHEVGLDPDETVQRFLQQFPVDDVTAGSPLVAEADTRLEDDQERQRQLAGLLIALAIGIPLIALVVYFAFSSRQPASEAGGGGAGDAVVAAGRTGAGSGASGAGSTRGSGADTPAAGWARAVGGGTGNVSRAPGPGGAAGSGGAATGAGAGAGASGGAAAGAPADGVRLALAAAGPCWVRVSADGVVKYEGLLQNGDKQAIDARDRVYLEVGDAGMLGLTLNGRPGRRLGGAGEVVRINITPSNLSQWTAAVP